MKYVISTIIILLFCLSFVSAQVGNSNPKENFNPEETLSPDQARMIFEQAGLGDVAGDVVGGVGEVIQPFVTWLKYLVGGLFGLYILLVLIRIRYERKKVNLLKDIKYDLDHLNKHFGVPHSAHRKGFFGRLWAKIRGK